MRLHVYLLQKVCLFAEIDIKSHLNISRSCLSIKPEHTIPIEKFSLNMLLRGNVGFYITLCIRSLCIQYLLNSLFYRRAKDERDVSRLKGMITNLMNPFTRQGQLVSLTCLVASQAAPHDLLNAHEIGEAQVRGFIEERLEKKSVNFFAPIPHNKLQTFDPAIDKRRKTKQQAKSEVVRHRGRIAHYMLYVKLL